MRSTSRSNCSRIRGSVRPPNGDSSSTLMARSNSVLRPFHVAGFEFELAGLEVTVGFREQHDDGIFNGRIGGSERCGWPSSLTRWGSSQRRLPGTRATCGDERQQRKDSEARCRASNHSGAPKPRRPTGQRIVSRPPSVRGLRVTLWHRAKRTLYAWLYSGGLGPPPDAAQQRQTSMAERCYHLGEGRSNNKSNWLSTKRPFRRGAFQPRSHAAVHTGADRFTPGSAQCGRCGSHRPVPAPTA